MPCKHASRAADDATATNRATSQSSPFSPSFFDGEKVAEGRMRGRLLMHRVRYNTRPGTS
jgi:hypothetical protein